MEVRVLPDQAVARSRRQAILELQHAIQALPTQGAPIIQITAEHCPVRHHFAPHSYGREMQLPQGAVVVGKIHKHAHVNVISQGRVRVFTEGEGALELQAPLTFVSSPGTKRVVEVLEDTVWTTFHVVDIAHPTESDLPAIEQEVIATNYQEDCT